MRRKLALALLAVGAVATPVLAWGHTGHSMINHLAVEVLPDGPLKGFFKKHQEWVSAHAVDPDIYKKSHREEAPRHFLNMCSGGIRAEDYPRTWKAAVDKWGLHTATKQGTLPWTIQETFDALVQAFKDKDGSKIVEKATWLGHYVGDAHVPFHACANFDGQDTGQKGIHAIWESNMLDHNTDEIAKAAAKLAAAMPVAVISDPTGWAFERLIAGDHYAHEILAKDKGTRTSGREKALWKATGDIAEKRVAEAATGLASLWLSAWTKAGKPALPENVKLDTSPSASGGNNDDERRDDKSSNDTPKMDPPKADSPAPADAPKADEPKPEAPKADEPKPEAQKPAAPDTGKPSANAQKSPIPGLMVRDDGDQPGAIVDFVETGTTAASSGLLKGDVIISVDGGPVNSCSTLTFRFQDYKSGDSVGVTVLRAGAETFVKIRMP